MDYTKINVPSLILLKHTIPNMKIIDRKIKDQSKIINQIENDYHKKIMKQELETFKNKLYGLYDLFETHTGFNPREFKLHEYIEFLFKQSNLIEKSYLKNHPYIYSVFLIEQNESHLVLDITSKQSFEDWSVDFYKYYGDVWYEHLKDIPNFIVEQSEKINVNINVSDKHGNRN